MVSGRAGPEHPHDTAGVRVVVASPVDRVAEFTAFMASSSPALARTAWLLCGDAHQAEELVQQTFTRVYLSWSRAREGNPLAYARRTLANLNTDTWRRRRREVLLATVPDAGVTGGEERHADRDRLVRALATLTRRQRRIVVLRHLEGLSEREVADALGVSVGTVKSTASRGLAQLRTVLGSLEGSQEGEAG